MKLLKYLKSMFVRQHLENVGKEVEPEPIKLPIKENTQRLLTTSQAAKKNNSTRQAIFFAIKMKRLNAIKENDTWLIAESDLKEYFVNKYSRAKSTKEGELIFDKGKGYYSIAEASEFLGKNTNHIYYLVRMGKLKSHRQGTAIVIHEKELHKYAEFISQQPNRKQCTG